MVRGLRSSRVLPLEKSLRGEKRKRQCRDQHDRDCGGHRPIPVIEKFVPQNLADHQRAGPAQQIGNDEFAGRRDQYEQRTGGKRFDRLEDVITQDEMKAIFESYQKVAGYHVQQVSRPQG